MAARPLVSVQGLEGAAEGQVRRAAGVLSAGMAGAWQPGQPIDSG